MVFHVTNHVNKHHVNRQCPSVQPNLLGSYLCRPNNSMYDYMVSSRNKERSRVATSDLESQPKAVTSRNGTRNWGLGLSWSGYESQQDSQPWFRFMLFVSVCVLVSTRNRVWFRVAMGDPDSQPPVVTGCVTDFLIYSS
ncbi:hypothetical protein HanIR_Chr11g0539311 [Helianthus annuus]|nr:hypothetical protein HanIR_Chr11g0539311 [Helianthus annuus]